MDNKLYKLKKRIYQWLLKKVYPVWYEKDKSKIELLEEGNERLLKMVTELRGNIRVKEETSPTMADLMRDILGLPMVDFANVDKEGYPPHFLDGLDKDARLAFMTELNTIYTSKAFQAVTNYWVNMFGNHSIRNGSGNSKPAQFSLNGIAMIRKELERAHNEIVEGSKPPEDFDKLDPLPEDN